MGKRGPKGKSTEWLEPDGLLQIRGWARDGYTDAQIAKMIGIVPQTFCTWKNDSKELREAIKQGRRPVIEEVEDAFYKAAKGYEVEEKVEEITVSPDGKQTKHIRKTTRHIPPQAALVIYALKNLKKGKYKDKPVDDAENQVEPVKVIVDV